MAKDFTKGIDNVFSPTVPEKGKEKKTELPENATDELVAYNVRYPKSIQKRMKRFCIDHDGMDMRDVFIQGAVMLMDKYDKTTN